MLGATHFYIYSVQSRMKTIDIVFGMFVVSQMNVNTGCILHGVIPKHPAFWFILERQIKISAVSNI